MIHIQPIFGNKWKIEADPRSISETNEDEKRDRDEQSNSQNILKRNQTRTSEPNSDLFIFDSKNGLFNAQSVEIKQNPRSSCDHYGCNGFGSLIPNKSNHKSSENCSNFKVKYKYFY